MKIDKLKIYGIDILIGILCIVIFLLRNNPLVAAKVNLLFWIIAAIAYFIRHGFYKNNGYYKKTSINYTLICCLSYLLIIYLSGILLGFSKSVFNFSFIGIIKNIYEPLILLVTQVYITNIIAKKNENRIKRLILFCVMCSLNNILLNEITYSFLNNESVFIFICIYMIPIIARQFLYMYLCSKASYIPCLIVGFVADVMIYLLPIYPNLGNFLEAVTSLLLPFLIFYIVSKVVSYSQKKELNFKKFSIRVTTIPLLIFAGIVVILVSGVFRYKMIAIVSNSMNNAFYRGDAVIYDQKIDINDLKVGDVIAFRADNKIVTHRIVDKYFSEGNNYFVTKGDANNVNDEPIVADEVMGKIDSVVKYLGFPTLWFREIFDRNR